MFVSIFFSFHQEKPNNEIHCSIVVWLVIRCINSNLLVLKNGIYSYQRDSGSD